MEGFMGFCSAMIKLAVVSAVLLDFGHDSNAAMAPSAIIQFGEDWFGPLYSGISNPPGSAQVNIVGSSPGYLNDITGGSNGGATGAIGILDPYQNDTELLAIAI